LVHFWRTWHHNFGILTSRLYGMHGYLVYVMTIWYILRLFGVCFPFWYSVLCKVNLATLVQSSRLSKPNGTHSGMTSLHTYTLHRSHIHTYVHTCINVSESSVLGSMLWSLISAIFVNFQRNIWRLSRKPHVIKRFL
jgi:hypothetical protein